MQTPSPTPPAQPVRIQVPGSPDVVINPGLSGSEVAALRAEREELSNQLTSAAGRRNELARQLTNADASLKPGIQERIRILDARIVRLEADLDGVGQKLATAGPGLLTEQQMPFGPGSFRMDSDTFAFLTGLFMLVVLFPIAFGMGRFMWKRAVSPKPAPVPDEMLKRLDRLEQAIDTVSIEMERVSEGQRFISRVLTEGAPGGPLALGAGAAPEIKVQQREREAARREER